MKKRRTQAERVHANCVAYIERRGWGSQRTIAIEAGVSESVMSIFIRHGVPPRFDSLEAIEDALRRLSRKKVKR